MPIDPELIEYLDRRFNEGAARFEQVDARFEQVDQSIRETNVLVEDLRGAVQIVAEGVIANGEALRAFRTEMDRQLEEVKAVNRLSYAELDRRLREHDRRLEIREGD